MTRDAQALRSTDEPSSAREFYSGLFDWRFEKIDMGEAGSYFMVRPTDGPEGGITGKQMPEQPTAWMPYVQVEDIGVTITKSESLGGQTIMPETPIPAWARLQCCGSDRCDAGNLASLLSAGQGRSGARAGPALCGNTAAPSAEGGD